MSNIINNLVGSDSGNYHPLNITTCKEVKMSNDIYSSVKNFINVNPHLFKFKKSKEFSDSCKGHLNSFYGKKHTKQTKEFLSKKQTGVPIHSEKWKKELSKRMKLNNIGGFREENGFYGKKHSEVSLKKIREARAKQVITIETRKKMSEARKKHWAKLKRKS